MSRVKKSPASRRRRKGFLKLAEGYRGGRSRLYRTARETVQKALAYSYRDRKVKKRDFRRLWIIRINAQANQNGISYSNFIDGLKKAKIALDRKMLAELAVNGKKAFAELAKIAKEESRGK
ncbi:MAG: 50S ribosomal protein L20 [Candidatus Omnitrophota bacterium]|nr:50S ribosomal protein L20 [Candidatus Omnitrophota bacterium]